MYVGIQNNKINNKKILEYSGLNFNYLTKYEQIYYLNNINKPYDYNIEKANKFLEDLYNYDRSPQNFNKIGLYFDVRLQKYPLIPDYRHILIILERDLNDLTYLIVETNTKTQDYVRAITEFLSREKLFTHTIDILSDYLESMEITIDVVKNIRKILEKIKDKDTFKKYSRLFEEFFEGIF